MCRTWFVCRRRFALVSLSLRSMIRRLPSDVGGGNSNGSPQCFFSVGMSAIRGSSPILPNWRRSSAIPASLRASPVARGLAFANEASLRRKTSIALTRMTMLRTVVPSYNSVQRAIDAKASRTNDAFRRWNMEYRILRRSQRQRD